MLKLLLPLLFICSVLSVPHNHHIHHESSPDTPSHLAYFNRPCCLQQGGKQCGHIWKTCCVGECKDFMMIQHCTGRQIPILPQTCSNSCTKQCHDKGGIICGTSFVRDTCCAPQNCVGAVSFIRECKPGTKIELANCAPNTVI